MKSTRKLVIRILALLIVIGIAAAMFVIGRGHTVYFDNKDLEADGTEYKSSYRIDVYVDGAEEPVAKLKSGDRGMTTIMGQEITMILHITPEKDAKKVGSKVTLKIPYNMDGIILNLPAILGGAPEEVYMEEFIPTPSAEESEDEEVVVTDEFEMPMGDE